MREALLTDSTGWSTVVGWIFTTASTNLIYAQNFMAMVSLLHPKLEITTWQTFVVYQGFNLLTSAIPMFANRLIPGLNRFSLFYLQIAWFVIMIVVAAKAPSHRDAEFVFRTWINETGWKNNAICFITGLVNPLYSLGGLDGISHVTVFSLLTPAPMVHLWMSTDALHQEEIPNPSRNAPLAIACTLGIAFVTGLSYLLSLMFSVQDYSALSSTPTGLPLAELFLQSVTSRSGAFVLTFMVWIAIGPCMVSSQLSTGRVFWAFSRDGGLPFSRVWSQVHPALKIPLNAQMAVTAIIAVLGCLYLGSSTAFNALLGSSVTINNFAYLVPILTNLLVGRSHMEHVRGVFWMGRWGWWVNIVTVGWLCFAICFFSWPYYYPVTGEFPASPRLRFKSSS
jgi:choline transport protein